MTPKNGGESNRQEMEHEMDATNDKDWKGLLGLDMGSQPGSDPDGQQPSTVALQTIINWTILVHQYRA